MAAPTDGENVATTEQPPKALGLAAHDSSGLLSPFPFYRRKNGDNDVTIKILYCGICHSDLHSLINEWQNTVYPIIPGHEITGEITEVGSNVKNFKLGDKVGVGYIVDSCRTCESCTKGFENYCPEMVVTYNSMHPAYGTVTLGGFSDTIVVSKDYVIHIPESLPLDKVAPLLCAGITVYSPMKYHELNTPGKHLGVVGLGGLGHVAVKFGKAFGMKVTVISSSLRKEKEAIERLGADAFLVSTNDEQMKAAKASMDGIIDTVSAAHPITPLLGLLKPNGRMILVGVPAKPLEVPSFALINGGKSLAGSGTGGIKDTQEMIDFAAKHNVTADIELVSADYVNKAIERLVKSDVRYRFVIDIGNTLKSSI